MLAGSRAGARLVQPRCRTCRAPPQAACPWPLPPPAAQQHRRCRHQRAPPPAATGRQPPSQQQLLDLEAAVPAEQRPVNELAQLKGAFLYSWARLPMEQYVQRLAAVFAVSFVFLSAPIANVTFSATQQPLECLLSASTGSLFVTAVVTLRIFLGFQYVGDRLLSAAVPYEESGWYDGQIFVKPPEVLTRDRLLACYEVRPVLAKVRRTLLAMGVLLLAVSVTLFGLIQAGTDEDGVYGRGSRRPVPRQVTADGVLFSKQAAKFRDLSQLANDDDLAAAEAEAQGGVPGYCADRSLRALAGGQYCAKFDR